MKKLITTLIALAMIISISAPAFAIADDARFKQIGEFRVAETIDSYNRITRIYEKDRTLMPSENEAKAQENNYKDTK